MPAPAPIYRAVSAPFWTGMRDGRLMIQRCDACRRFVFYPRPFCHHCWAEDPTWEQIPPFGRLVSFTVAHVPPSIDFREAWPALPAIVALAEDVRMASALVDVEASAVWIGMPLRMLFPDRQAKTPVAPSFTRDTL